MTRESGAGPEGTESPDGESEWTQVKVVVDAGAAEHVTPRSMFTEISTKKQSCPRVEKGSTDQEESTSKIIGSKSSPSDLPKDSFVRKSTWQVADVRRPLVSASHIIQVGNDLFIGKDEECIMNRKKKEKSVLRKEGNVHVLDLFVKVPSGAAELQTEDSKGNELRWTAANRFF